MYGLSKWRPRLPASLSTLSGGAGRGRTFSDRLVSREKEPGERESLLGIDSLLWTVSIWGGVCPRARCPYRVSLWIVFNGPTVKPSDVSIGGLHALETVHTIRAAVRAHGRAPLLDPDAECQGEVGRTPAGISRKNPFGIDPDVRHEDAPVGCLGVGSGQCRGVYPNHRDRDRYRHHRHSVRLRKKFSRTARREAWAS